MRAFLIFAASLCIATTARADIIVPASSAVVGTAGAPGLVGTFYHEGTGTTGYSVAQTIALMNSSTATGTFVSSSVNYNGSDSSTITAFLGADGSSYRGPTPKAFDLSDAILNLKGYFFVPTAETVQFSLNHDDAAQFSIGSQVLFSSSIGKDTANASFTAPGYYAVNLIYANTNYYNVGGATVDLMANNATVTAANFAQTVVPEPSTIALIGALLGGIVLMRLRRRHESLLRSP